MLIKIESLMRFRREFVVFLNFYLFRVPLEDSFRTN
jgi:hypothetical protein